MEDREPNATDQESQLEGAEPILEDAQKSKIDSDLLQNISVYLIFRGRKNSPKIKGHYEPQPRQRGVELSKACGRAA